MLSHDNNFKGCIHELSFEREVVSNTVLLKYETATLGAFMVTSSIENCKYTPSRPLKLILFSLNINFH